MRYGLRGQKARTLEEVGRAFGVTRERIRQIENNTLKKLEDSPRRSASGTPHKPHRRAARPAALPSSSKPLLA